MFQNMVNGPILGKCVLLNTIFKAYHVKRLLLLPCNCFRDDAMLSKVPYCFKLRAFFMFEQVIFLSRNHVFKQQNSTVRLKHNVFLELHVKFVIILRALKLCLNMSEQLQLFTVILIDYSSVWLYKNVFLSCLLIPNFLVTKSLKKLTKQNFQSELATQKSSRKNFLR